VRYLPDVEQFGVAAPTLGASYVMALVLQLNPTLSLHPRRLLPLVLTVGVFYAAHLTVIFYVWLVVRQLFARELFTGVDERRRAVVARRPRRRRAPRSCGRTCGRSRWC
jgi:hypothetical protein